MKFTDIESIKNKYGISEGGDWMNLKEGENRIRIVSEFVDYGIHRDPELKKNVVCIGKEQCYYCKQGDKVRVQFLGKVIDRSDGRVKYLRIGYRIFQQISELAKSKEYGFDIIPPYDIVILKKGSGLNTTYTVFPARENTPLTDEEVKKAEALPSPSEIIEKMKEKVPLYPE